MEVKTVTVHVNGKELTASSVRVTSHWCVFYWLPEEDYLGKEAVVSNVLDVTRNCVERDTSRDNREAVNPPVYMLIRVHEYVEKVQDKHYLVGRQVLEFSSCLHLE